MGKSKECDLQVTVEWLGARGSEYFCHKEWFWKIVSIEKNPGFFHKTLVLRFPSMTLRKAFVKSACADGKMYGTHCLMTRMSKHPEIPHAWVNNPNDIDIERLMAISNKYCKGDELCRKLNEH